MRQASDVLLVKVNPNTLPMSASSKVFERLRQQFTRLQRRAPDDSAEAWVQASIGGRQWKMAQPLTFTPYASVQPCSARCRFCSENLRGLDGGRSGASLRPAPDYFDQLRRALRELMGVPLSFSLSGLEMTDDEDWFLQLLQVLQQAEVAGLQVEQRVLYSNGAGFAREGGERLLDALKAFKLSWIELSRHSQNEIDNQAIMRFRAHEPAAKVDAFVDVARQLSAHFPVKMVCILQKDGVATAAALQTYVHWATQEAGATTVIFRELSRMGADYLENGTYRYIEEHRVGLDDLLEECMSTDWWNTLEPLELTEGYYFWNVRMRTPEGAVVVFEASDYTVMHRQHASGAVYKLVFFADGRLCSGWESDRDLIWDARQHG